MIAAVIFDFDGVLADTEGLHLRSFQQTFARRGWPLDERAYFDRYLGYDDAGLIDAYARDHGLAVTAVERESLVADKSVAFRTLLANGVALYPGARRCVERLGARFPLAIASGSLHGEILDILTGSGLADAFRAIVGADDVAQTKPAPEPYLRAAALLGVDAARCVAVEDSHWGLTSARAAGMRTIAVVTTSAASALSEADRIIATLDELTDDVLA